MVMSMSDVNKQFDGEWVFMIDCERSHDGNLVGGEVVLHSKSRDEIFRNMSKYAGHDSMTSIRFAGKIPEGVVVIL